MVTATKQTRFSKYVMVARYNLSFTLVEHVGHSVELVFIKNRKQNNRSIYLHCHMEY